MLRTLLLFGGRVRRSPVLRPGAKVGAQDTKAAERALRRKAELAAEKQFMKLICTARTQRQRQIADAIRRALAAKSDAAATKNDARYVRNRKIARAELAAVHREVAQKAAEARKAQAAKPVKARLVRQPSRMLDKKKQAANEKRFLATLQQRLERRKARVAALVAKTAKMEEAKAKAKAKTEAKVEALAKAEAAAKAEQRFEETIRRRHEQRAARVKVLVEKRTKVAAAEAEAATASQENEFTAELNRLMEERDARVQAIIAEHMNAAEVADSEQNAETPAPAPKAAASTSRKSQRNVNASAAALLDTSDEATAPATPQRKAAPTEVKAVEEPAKKPTTPRRRGRPASKPPHVATDVPSAAPVEAVDEAEAAASAVQEARAAEELLPSPSQPRRLAAADLEELASAHEDFVAHLEKAKERTTAPSSTRVSPVPSALASSSEAQRTWVMAENTTGLFRL
ncbi:conserved hypothetical protein [Leishmania infantum JPCM5]|uniref:Uncharacterized protein n=2 Tax=Leishmania infantum TaxID=5671 RepID=A4I9G6_LEIIN|nr:conserved hypothetical protein [Leishmania infantum JPCM5]CAC9535117.1 hypothetical_protein_-_conserved [Leishmania infantum]CAM71469.2 conserved hypothetical protein [Leishmania infantum JPCM5]SUZ45358.1 hypothetical_protein_-_conserved [Leishmania infantum]|eukprot:XP_001468385.2 conserved hypothetical protein [Leishmania infantum JPCM5]